MREEMGSDPPADTPRRLANVLKAGITPVDIGLVVGFGAAWLLHLAFPSQDLGFFQALIIGVGVLIGFLYCVPRRF